MMRTLMQTHTTRTHGQGDGACLNRSKRVIPRRCGSAVRTGVGHIGFNSNGHHRCVVLDGRVVNRLPRTIRDSRHCDGGGLRAVRRRLAHELMSIGNTP